MSGQTNDYKNLYISGVLEDDVTLLKEILKKDSVLRVKYIKARNTVHFDCAVIYLDGMADSVQLNDAVIKPLVVVDAPLHSETLSEYIEKQVLFARDVKKKRNIAEMLDGLLYGEALILIDKSQDALSVDIKGWRTRGISEPENERVLQGPREGFDEAALLNVAMISRRLKTPDFCAEVMSVGRRTSTLVFICYLDTLADEKIVAELKKRIKKIDIDGILDSNYIAEQIRDSRYSLFKTCGATERPDIVAARLLEGRIALIVDGTPVVLTVPYLFSENFQADEDYYLNFLIASSNRFLRYLSFFLSISIPAIFIALSTFHKELLPTSLAISVAQLRAGVPIAPFVECLIMIFVFEILKETGVRMPQSLGHALSIVGGLVVGQAAVEARIISTPMLIVIAISGISGLMIPRLKTAVFYLRLLLLFLAAFFGIYGYIVGVSAIVIHIISLTSFGIDYTVSLRKASFQTIKDTVWRAPWTKMQKRPAFNRNTVRLKGEKE